MDVGPPAPTPVQEVLEPQRPSPPSPPPPPQLQLSKPHPQELERQRAAHADALRRQEETIAGLQAAVAEMRGKDEYELGDLSIAIDKIVKEEVCQLSGKDECARQGSIPALRELHHANSRRSRAPCALIVRRVW